MTAAAISLAVTVLVGILVIGYVYWQHRTEFPDPAIVEESHLTKSALPVDPNNPPSLKVYRPKSGLVINCTCHARPLQPEDEVMWWPLPDSEGAVYVMCPQTIIEANEAGQR